jgi:hypothetical protein
MQITAEINIEDVIESISHGYGDNDPINFVLALDNWVGDEGFTEDLLLRLAQSYEQEYVSYEQSMTERALSTTFVDGVATSTHERLERTMTGLAQATSKREKLSKIVALIRSLDSDSNE